MGNAGPVSTRGKVNRQLEGKQEGFVIYFTSLTEAATT
jgi:hypothetical protein